MEELTIRQMQDRMAAGALTSSALVEAYLERIQKYDVEGPALNSVIELNPDALEIAAVLDDERVSGATRGPLHGVPVIVKDNLDTADAMMTTAGSLALEGSYAQQDSFVAKKLREAGAVIIAKANLSEWANYRSPYSSSGWSSRGGQTRNPYDTTRSPCGSSSGSGVAVAANFCSFAIGTETDGSIICPAQTSGIVGVKPTLGLVSRAGIIPISHSQDTAGPMTRTVEDAALVLGVLAGIDPADGATASSEDNGHTDYTQFLDADALKGARIGVARNFFGFNPKVDALMEQCIKQLIDQGADVVDPAELELDFRDLGKNEVEVLLYEYKHGLNAYLENLGPQAPVHSVKDLIAFNEKNADKVMPHFGQERVLAAHEKGPLTEETYLNARANSLRLAREQGIDATLARHRLDAIIAPSGGPAWVIDMVNGDPRSGGGSSSAAAVAGYPNITVPAGYIAGLPVGISFFASAYQEPTLFKLAYAFEQATNVRTPPRLG